MIFLIQFIYSIEWPKSEFQFPSTKPRSKEDKSILYYKAIYVMNNEVNVVFGTIIIPYLKVILMLLFVSAVFACARLFETISFLTLVFAAILSITTTGLLGPISIVMYRLYDLSLNFPKNLFAETLQSTGKKSRKYLEANLNSCPLIRCQIGSWYHMEGKAKLTMLHNTINGLAFLLINVKA